MNQPAGKADDRTARPGPGSHNLRQVLATDDVLLRDVVERLTRIPDSFRDFSVTPTGARKVHGIAADLLIRLTDLGLPVGSTVSAPLYDEIDLANITVALILPSPRMMAMRGWSQAIKTAANTIPTKYFLTIKCNCARDTHEGQCTVETAPQLRTLPSFSVSEGGEITLSRQVSGEMAAVYPEAAELTGLLRSIHFQLLPSSLSRDLGFLRETGLADCRLAAKYLVKQAKNFGLAARSSAGLLVAVPYSTPHFWLDLKLGGSWAPFDPHLLNLLTSKGLLPPRDWPPFRSIGDAVWRMGEEDFQIARPVGGTASVSFLTQIAKR